VIEAAHAQVAFRLPSFSQSIKNIGIRFSNGGMLEFAPDKEALRLIKAFMDQALVSTGGASEVTKLRKSGVNELIAGIAIALAGTVVTVGGYLVANTNGG